MVVNMEKFSMLSEEKTLLHITPNLSFNCSSFVLISSSFKRNILLFVKMRIINRAGGYSYAEYPHNGFGFLIGIVPSLNLVGQKLTIIN